MKEKPCTNETEHERHNKRKWTRLQGKEFARMKFHLKAYAYSITLNGNICLYYFGRYKHYLNDEEKQKFNPDGLKKIKHWKRGKKS